MNTHPQQPYDPLAPQQRPPPTPFEISPEDARILAECNKEAFYQRCLPFSFIASGLTILATKAGYLRAHPSWGYTPKLLGAAFLGYFAGKISYQQVCAERFMNNPNSPLGAALRARRKQGGGGSFQDALSLEMPGYSLPEGSSPDVYRDDSAPHTFTDLDTDRPYQRGLDDTYRSDIYSSAPQRPEDFVLPPQAPSSNSYDELRRQNREEFERKSRAYRAPDDSQRGAYQPPSRPPPGPAGEPSDRYKPSTNMYGDIFEK